MFRNWFPLHPALYPYVPGDLDYVTASTTHARTHDHTPPVLATTIDSFRVPCVLPRSSSTIRLYSRLIDRLLLAVFCVFAFRFFRFRCRLRYAPPVPAFSLASRLVSWSLHLFLCYHLPVLPAMQHGAPACSSLCPNLDLCQFRFHANLPAPAPPPDRSVCLVKPGCAMRTKHSE